MKSGFVYVPYIINEKIEVIYSDFTPSKVIKSRYSKKIINSGVYGSFSVEPFINEIRKNKIEKIFNNEDI
jgi:hypothetical protein